MRDAKSGKSARERNDVRETIAVDVRGCGRDYDCDPSTSGALTDLLAIQEQSVHGAEKEMSIPNPLHYLISLLE